jgi:phosphoribosylglycinamide formyltransferase-1
MPAARLVVLASGSGSNLAAIMAACDEGRLDAEVVAVISDREGAFALERARRAGIDHHHVPVAGRERADYDATLAGLVDLYSPHWVVLAGWMRILTMSFLGVFPDRVVNLHPALPGRFAGVRAIERAWEAGQAGEVDRTGVMVHLVPDEGVDDGPVLGTVELALRRDESLDELTARVHAAEHALLVDVLESLVTFRSPTLQHEET